MENSTNDTKKIIGALLIGTAVGAAIGILFAPAKGTETRKKISETKEDFTDTMTDKFNEFLATVKKEVEMVKEKVNYFSVDGKAKQEETKIKNWNLSFAELEKHNGRDHWIPTVVF